MAQKKNKKQKLTETFNAFAAKAIADFPQLRGKLVIYNMHTDTFHGSFSGQISNTVAKQLKKTATDKKNKPGNRAVAFAQDLQFFGHQAIGYIKGLRNKRRTIVGHSNSPERDILAVLEHELGHALTPRKIYDGDTLFRECIADAFSFTRQIQAYKTIDKPAEYYAWRRAYLLVKKGRWDHYTIPVVKAVQRLSRQHDLSKLTPVQTVNLAYRLSLQYAPQSAQTEHIAGRVFEPVRKEFKKDRMGALQKCAEIMLADHGAASDIVFTIGRDLLMPFLDRRLDIITSYITAPWAKELRLEDDFWDDIRAKIKTRESHIKEPPGQELDALQVLGRFDPHPDQLIEPTFYDKKRVKQVREEYAAKMGVKPSASPSPLRPSSR